MILLRYDTQDLVRPLLGPPDCALRSLPAVSHLLGKRCFAVRHQGGWVLARDILEALEAVEDVPLPAYCGLRSVNAGVEVDVVVRSARSSSRSMV
jgi:phenylacetate-CoA ligase